MELLEENHLLQRDYAEYRGITEGAVSQKITNNSFSLRDLLSAISLFKAKGTSVTLDYLTCQTDIRSPAEQQLKDSKKALSQVGA